MSADGDFIRATDLAADYITHMKKQSDDPFVLGSVFEQAARLVLLAMKVRGEELWGSEDDEDVISSEESAEYMRLWKLMSSMVPVSGQKVGE
jgi:hypothetical protein